MRRLDFEGVQNFRDLGGYRSRFGGSTRWGVLYRSDRLDKMSAADLVRFGELGIKRVFDLRNDDERATAPDPVPNVHVSIMSNVEDRGANLMPIDGLSQPQEAEAALRSLYDGILAYAGPDIGLILRSFADDDGLPALFHCTAGKDRTGVIAALLLELLGVGRDDILNDFELTNRYRSVDHQTDTVDHLTDQGMAPEAAAAMLDAPRWAMAGMLDDLDRNFGGIDHYIGQRALLDDDTITRIRVRLLDP